jgi:hypothetical protein
VVVFLILGYLGVQPPSPVGEKVSQLGTLLYFAFFLPCRCGAVPARSSRCRSASRSIRTKTLRDLQEDKDTR